MPRNNESAFGRGYRAAYKALGFYKGYNFPLWLMFGGGLLAFSLARLSYLNIAGVFASSASPGEWFWYRHGIDRIGITIHLGAILPCGILSVFQFVPVIRYKALIIHRIDGYIIYILLWVATAGALIIARRAFGGDPTTQAGTYFISLITIASSSMAYYNIKRLQIDQHRNWMLRTMFYMSSIITLRLVMVLSAKIITAIDSYYRLIACDELAFMVDNSTRFAKDYPTCATGDNFGYAAVHAEFKSDSTSEHVGAAFRMTFGMSMWVSVLLHVLGVEIYIRMTPAESERLRMVAYEKQLKAGLTPAGSAGLTADVWGDAVWAPKRRYDSEAPEAIPLHETSR